MNRRAVDYISKGERLAPKEIIPWLKGDKYYFMPVAEDEYGSVN